MANASCPRSNLTVRDIWLPPFFIVGSAEPPRLRLACRFVHFNASAQRARNVSNSRGPCTIVGTCGYH